MYETSLHVWRRFILFSSFPYLATSICEWKYKNEIRSVQAHISHVSACTAVLSYMLNWFTQVAWNTIFWSKSLLFTENQINHNFLWIRTGTQYVLINYNVLQKSVGRLIGAAITICFSQILSLKSVVWRNKNFLGICTYTQYVLNNYKGFWNSVEPF